MAFKASEAWAKIADQPFHKDSFTSDLEAGKQIITFPDGTATVNIYTHDTTNTVRDHDETATYVQNLGKIKNTVISNNSYTLDQKKEFSELLPEMVIQTNTGIKEGAKLVHNIVKEQLVPLVDAYRLGVLAAIATTAGMTIAPTANGLKDIGTLIAKVANAELLGDHPVLYVGYDSAMELQTGNLIQPFTAGLEKSLRTGDLGMLLGAKVKAIPATLLPSKVKAILVNPDVVSTPRKIAKTNVDKNPTGVFGQLYYGLFLYTCAISKVNQKGVAIIKTP